MHFLKADKTAISQESRSFARTFVVMPRIKKERERERERERDREKERQRDREKKRKSESQC